MALLVRLHYSPWSEKARWALDHHRVAYELREHAPILGEPLLRARARRLRGPVTVPLFVPDTGAPIMGSAAIARHADEVGRGARLFLPGRADEVARWDARADGLIELARVLVVARIEADPEIQRASLPPFLPSALRGALSPMAVMGSRFIRWKYAADGGEDAVHDRMRRMLDELRRALDGKPYLLGEFSFADLAMAVAMQAVSPVEHAAWPISAPIRRCWTTPEVAAEAADLLAWRDRVFRDHRSA
ncbi:MAG: glutathione S-transferase [Polyangiaceae bacterium]|nr:glutathione S-transferase [Polyangiaceae bacterium]